MITFLFWNLKRKPLQAIIAKIALEHQVDILIFAECVIPPDVLLINLNQSDTSAEYHYAPSIDCEKIKIFTKFYSAFIPPIFEDHRLTIRHLKLPGLTDILVSATHFPSKNYWKDSSQMAECFILANSIRFVEEQIGHSRTILVGDLNMNPFEEGVVIANGLHGVMSRRVAQRKTRKVQGRAYPFFYNPMWNFLGDASSHPPGTYYLSSSEHMAFFWHIFDQVLVRPDLLDVFHSSDIQILSSDGKVSFLSQEGIPDAQVASDHLPILFKLRL